MLPHVRWSLLYAQMASIVMRYDSFLGTKKKKLNARPAGTKEHLFTAKDEENVKTMLTNPNSFSPVIIIAKP